jgi:large subunit ribosomal protein L6
MSRIGKQPVVLPKGITAKIEGARILIEGPKGKDSLGIPASIKVVVEGAQIIVTRNSEEKLDKSLHGTIRALINSYVQGVNQGYKKELDIVGVGYKAQMKGTVLNLNLGFSHVVEMPVPAGLKVATPNPNRIVVDGFNKQQVGEFAAKIKKVYPVEPYQGKGVRYVGEEVKKKLGKALAK